MQLPLECLHLRISRYLGKGVLLLELSLPPHVLLHPLQLIKRGLLLVELLLRHSLQLSLQVLLLIKLRRHSLQLSLQVLLLIKLRRHLLLLIELRGHLLHWLLVKLLGHLSLLGSPLYRLLLHYLLLHRLCLRTAKA